MTASFLRILFAVLAVVLLPAVSAAQTVVEQNIVLGRPTGRTIAIGLLPSLSGEAYVEYGMRSGLYSAQSPVAAIVRSRPMEIELGGLEPDTKYFYRVHTRADAQRPWAPTSEHSFQTARSSGSTFKFAIQGDSHPERAGRMFQSDLYSRTLDLVARERPDFYLMLGDDFSLQPAITRRQLSAAAVEAVYANQRTYLARMTHSTALFLANGNHEEAGGVWLDGTPNNPAVLAGVARTRFFPLPAPDDFYSGDRSPVEFIGLLRDYYAWTWGDALFVVIEPYWHSPAPVDTLAMELLDRAGRGRDRDWWGISIGDEQYRWLKATLEGSEAKYKFVFAHHVLGTGRGGVEMAGQYEWGGRGRGGAWDFPAYRPTWEMPIHQLFVKTGVSAFFFGHDHIYARQELDGVVYQSTPNPADPTYTAFNDGAYRSGNVLPNSGHLLVTVGPQEARVDYVRSFLPANEKAGQRHGEIAASYRIAPRTPLR